MVFEFLKKLLPSKRTPFDNIIYLIKKGDTQRAILELQALRTRVKPETKTLIRAVIESLRAKDTRKALEQLKQN